MDITSLLIVLVGIGIVMWLLRMIKKGIMLLLTISVIAIGSSWLLADTTWDDEFKGEAVAASFGQESWQLLSGLVTFIKDSNLDLNFEENKLSFSNKNGFDGEIAKREDIIYLKTASPSDDTSSTAAILKLAQLFFQSDDRMSKMKMAVEEDTIGKIPLGDGSYINRAEGLLTIYLQKKLE